jgi:tetratricopeptide (TPR) repeat protein
LYLIKGNADYYKKALEALALSKTDPEIFLILAYHFSHNSNLDKALKCLDKALTLRPDFKEAGWLYFIITANQGQLEKGIEVLQRMNSYNGINYFAYYYIGLNHLNQGDYESAITSLQSAIKFYSIEMTRFN